MSRHVSNSTYTRQCTPEQYFWDRVNKDGPIPKAYPELGPCWIWTGNISGDGYGRYYFKGIALQAHVYSFVLHGGILDPALERDHKCDVRSCVNPEHIQQVTQTVNTLRGNSPPAQNARKTLCTEGHELTGVRKSGTRYCKECNRIRANAAYADKKATGKPFKWGGVKIKGGESPTAINAAKTHCIRGHLITGVKKSGKGRYCTVCASDSHLRSK